MIKNFNTSGSLYEVKSSSTNFELRYYHTEKQYKVYAESIDKVSDYFAEITNTSKIEMLIFFTEHLLTFIDKYKLQTTLFDGPSEDLITCYKDIDIKETIDLCRECTGKGLYCIDIPGVHGKQCLSLYKDRGSRSATIVVCYSRLAKRKLESSQKETDKSILSQNTMY